MATAFDIGGLLGSAFGGDELGDFLTSEQRAAIQQRGLLSAAAALLQAGGPSRTPTSLGQALGAAFEAGQTGTEKAQQSALTQILTRQKLEEARRGQELQKRIGDILAPGAIAPAAGGEITAAEALAAPGMAAGPTAERAALIGQPRPAAPAMSANEMRAQQYLRAADEYARAGMVEDAKRFTEIAERFMPKQREVVGQPIKTATGYVQQTKTGEFIQVPKEFEPFIQAKPVGAPFKATDPVTNKEILVQSYDDGSKRPLEGFGPPREVVLANVDNKIVAIDKSTVAPGTTFGTGISPVDQARLDMEKQRLDIERRRLGISEAEFARNAYERIETAQGIMYVPKRPGAPVIPLMDVTGRPLMGAGGGKPTEGETNAAGFAQRMERAIDVISNLPAGSQPGVRAAVSGSLPVVGGVAQRRAMTPEQQQYKQAADDWIRAKLRKESGAAIGVDEMQKEYETYFPQIGDTPEVIRQKTEARAIATNAMKTSAGNSYRPYVPPPRTDAPKEGDTSKDRNGRNIVFRNGRWEYQ